MIELPPKKSTIVVKTGDIDPEKPYSGLLADHQKKLFVLTYQESQLTRREVVVYGFDRNRVWGVRDRKVETFEYNPNGYLVTM